MMSSHQKPTLIFLHILKTAGTTLNIILENYYSRDKSYATFPNRQHPNGSLEGFKALSVAEKKNLDLLTGHMGFGLHKHLPRPAEYITILRNPIKREISRYFHEKRDPHSHLHEAIQNGMSLAEYVRFYATAGEMDNLQTRMIAGNWENRGFGPCTEQLLETAKSNLQNHFVIAGLTERFDETYLLLQKHFGWHTVYYKKHNVAPYRPRMQDFSEETLDVIRHYNRYDIEQYFFASWQFEQQIRQQTWTFPLELKWFQFQNWLHKIYMEIRKHSLRVFLQKRFLTNLTKTATPASKE